MAKTMIEVSTEISKRLSIAAILQDKKKHIMVEEMLIVALKPFESQMQKHKFR